MGFKHETVLLNETIDSLNVKPDGVYVDCTLGGAGHAYYLLSQLNEGGHLYAFDQDLTAIENAYNVLKPFVDAGLVTFIHTNFRNIKSALSEYGITQVDGIYYDLGVSSPQLDIAQRGFSYRLEAPLDMRMDQTQTLTAREVVNEWSYESLVRILYRYADERFAKRIARAIELERKVQPIELTTHLADIVKEAIPAATRRTGGHPAKRTFQAVRIAVNDELGAVETSIEDGLRLLKPHGRMSVISFHSLEDRIVKHLFKEASAAPQLPPNLPVLPQEYQADYRMVTRKPIIATQEELEQNNRSRSAKLRVIERQ